MQTNEADRTKSEQALLDCYKAAALSAPKYIFWHANPLVTAFAGPIIAHQLEGGRVRKQPENLFNGINAIEREFTRRVLGFVNEALDQLKPTKRGIQHINFKTVENALFKNVEDELHLYSCASELARHDSVLAPASESAQLSTRCALLMRRATKEATGMLDRNGTFTEIITKGADTFAGPAFAREAQLLKGTPFASLVEACGWVWPHEHFAVMTDNPAYVTFAENPLKIYLRDKWVFTDA